MDNILKEDFYYCKTDWLKVTNPFRVFRLKEVTEVNGEMFFIPMVDGVFITKDEHVEDNGSVVLDTFMGTMRLATYREIEPYINYIYNNTESTITLYDVTKEKREFFEKMEQKFWYEEKFSYILNELRSFKHDQFYHENERIALSMLRSYYKCRILNV